MDKSIPRSNEFPFYQRIRFNSVKLFRWLVWLSFLILSIDFVYKTINHISYIDRSQCIINQALPPILFLFYEYFIELIMIIVVGIFISVLLEAWFSRFSRFYPTNPVTAFVYASIMPVCSCSVLPLLHTLDNKLSYRTLITFIVAAPLLSPYIIVLSFSILGPVYGTLRIISSFLIAIMAGSVMSLVPGGHKEVKKGLSLPCNAAGCNVYTGGTMEKSLQIFKSILPYLFMAGSMGIIFELLLPMQFMAKMGALSGATGLLVFALSGIPIYFCHGTDVLFLRPLICNGLGLGTAITFSLTSTAICVSSFIMLLKFIGKKQTVILTTVILILSLGMGMLVNVLAG